MEGSDGLQRAGVVLAAILLALLGAIFIVAAVDLVDTPTCFDVDRGLAEPVDNECYDGRELRRNVSGALLGLGGVAAVLALIPGIAFGARKKWLQIFLILAGSAVLLSLLGFATGNIG